MWQFEKENKKSNIEERKGNLAVEQCISGKNGKCKQDKKTMVKIMVASCINQTYYEYSSVANKKIKKKKNSNEANNKTAECSWIDRDKENKKKDNAIRWRRTEAYCVCFAAEYLQKDAGHYYLEKRNLIASAKKTSNFTYGQS